MKKLKNTASAQLCGSESQLRFVFCRVSENGAIGSLEEHFRKSLGDDYSKVFQQDKNKGKKPAEQPSVDPVKAFKEDLDMTGYTGKV